MILTASSVSDLSNALTWWEHGEYVFSIIVAAACFGEYVADFKPKWYRTGDTERDKSRKESISKLSTLVLVAALVFELVCVVRSNALAGEVIGSINGLATSAVGQSKTAFDNARTAKILAQSASDTAQPAKATADEAKGEADRAGTSASNAMVLAHGARQEAHSIENDLAETKKRVEYVHKEAFERILSPRFSEALKGRPAGTVEIRVDTRDNDDFMFAIQITDALRKAGWNASDPLPISWDRGKSVLPSPPTEMKFQVSGTLCLIARENVIQPGVNTAAGAIWDAYRSAEEINGDCASALDKTLPDDHFVLVIGQKN